MTGDVRFFEELEEEAERRLRESGAAGSSEDSLRDELRAMGERLEALEALEALAAKVISQDEEIAELREENRTLREIVGTLDLQIPYMLEDGVAADARARGTWAEYLELVSRRRKAAVHGGFWVRDHEAKLEKLLDGPDPGEITKKRIDFLLRTLSTPEKPALERRKICETWKLSKRQEKHLFRHLVKTGWFVLRARDPRKRPGRGNPQIITISDKGRAEARRS